MLEEWLPRDVWHCWFGGCSSLDASFLVLLIGWTPEDGPKEKLAQVAAGCAQEHMDIIFIAEEPGAIKIKNDVIVWQ